MANEFARNIQDASLNPATFTLPAAASTSTESEGVDLGADTFRPESMEVELSVPALSATIAPAASTDGATFIIEVSSSSTFNGVREIARKTIAGNAAGIAAQKLRARIPSDCEQHLRGKVSFGASMTDASALAATLSLRH